VDLDQATLDREIAAIGELNAQVSALAAALADQPDPCSFWLPA
jgi:hypothetical protein